VTEKLFDLIAVGRVSMDLFSQNVGAPFVSIEGFDASVGGSPTNIAIGSSRLGLKVALLTAVGEDAVGDFVLRYLQKEGVETQYIPRKSNGRTGLAVVGVQPPDQFPLVFYRDNPADIHITIDDVLRAPIGQSRVLLISGTALSRGSCRDATLFAAEQADTEEVTTFMDLDLRPDQWVHSRAYGVSLRSLLPRLNVVIGTEEEFFAALVPSPGNGPAGKPITPSQRDELETALRSWLQRPQGPRVWVVKKGPGGVSVYTRQGDVINVPGFSVEVLNTVGAGDAFAGGFIYGYLKGWDWYKCARMGNACGALVVTRHGCAKALPYERETQDFVLANGGF